MIEYRVELFSSEAPPTSGRYIAELEQCLKSGGDQGWRLVHLWRIGWKCTLVWERFNVAG